jgi:hypothetical protein
LRALAHQVGRFSDVSIAVGGPDNGACLDEGRDAGCIPARTQNAEWNQSWSEGQGVYNARHHAGQPPLIGRVEPGYRMMALGRRQSSRERVAKIMNTVLKRGQRVLGL